MPKEDKCSSCKREVFLHPTLSLLFAVCDHPYCSGCVQRLFTTVAELPCLVCDTTLKRTTFVDPRFDVEEFERECAIRLKIGNIFNKRREEFSTLLEYNDYLEMVEDICINLVEKVDMEKTREKVEEYQRHNLATIAANRQREEEERVAQIRREEENLQKRTERLKLLELQSEEKRMHVLQENERRIKAIETGKQYRPTQLKLTTVLPKAEEISVEEAVPQASAPLEADATGVFSAKDVQYQPSAVRKSERLQPRQKPKVSRNRDSFPYTVVAAAGGYDEEVSKLRAKEEFLNTLFL